MSLYEGEWITGDDRTLIEGRATNGAAGSLVEGQWVVTGGTPAFREGRVFYGIGDLLEGASTVSSPGDALLWRPIGSWYDARDTGPDDQLIPSRVGAGVAQRGSTPGVDANDPTFAADGESRAGWSFDGVDDYLQLPESDTPTITASAGKLTVAVLFQAPSSAFSRVLWDARSAGANGLTLMLVGGSDVVRWGTYGASGSVVLNMEASVANGVHVAAGVIDQGTSYCWNDVEGATPPADISAVGAITLRQPRVGVISFSTTAPYSGWVYMVRAFPGLALAAPELVSLAAEMKRQVAA